MEGPRDSPLGLEGSWDHLDLSEANILSLRMRMSKDMSGKGRNWKIYMRMMNCQRWRGRNCEVGDGGSDGWRHTGMGRVQRMHSLM